MIILFFIVGQQQIFNQNLINQKNMNKFLPLTLLCLLIVLSCSSKLKHKPPTPQQKHTVVEANHFFSDTDLTTTYNVGKVQKDLGLILILRPKDQETKQTQKIHFKLSSGSKTVDCDFSNFNSVCVMDSVQDPQMTMNLKCSKLPCEAYWTIYQANPKKPNGLVKLQDLYQLPEGNKHTIVMLTCNNPEVKDYDKAINMYTDANYTPAYTSGVLFYLIANNPKKSYMYFRAKQQAAKLCTMVGIYTTPQAIKDQVEVKDFVTNSQKSIFKLNSVPKNLFRIDASMHQLMKKTAAKSAIQISLTAQKSGKRQVLSKSIISPVGQKKTYDYSYIFSPIPEGYTDAKIQMMSQDKIIMINFQLALDEKPQVQRGQTSYFKLKKGQKIIYKIEAESQAKQSQKAFIKANDQKKIKISPAECQISKGCEITVQALQDTDTNFITISDNPSLTAQKVQGTITYFDILNRQVKKIKEEDIIYFKRTLQAKKSYQIVVNSANVIIYAASKEKCPNNPGKHCYEKVANNLHPFIYETQKQTQLRIAVIGLDNCEFTLTIIDEDTQFIELVDGVGFEYEFDDQQEQVAFTFTLATQKKKKNVSFNLISPLHSLELYVENGKQKPKIDETDYKSLDGFISFNKQQIKGQTFTILVRKTKQMMKSFVHFTIIVSTQETNMRLQPGITHYETMQPNDVRKFVFQFNTQESAAINIYSHNTKGLFQLNLVMQVSNDDKNWEKDSVQEYTIDQSQDILQLSDISKQLCKDQESSHCEIFIRVANAMQQRIDVSFTLVVSNSIIQLTNGLWSNFVVSGATSSSHFYYTPKNKDKAINIMYKSTFDSLRISYAIWKAQDKNINPSEWPFPASTVKQNDKVDYGFSFRPLKHLSIGQEALKKCWPSCVILLSLVQLQSLVPAQMNKFNQMHIQDYFSIMLTDSYIQLPEQQKVDIFLQNGQTKFLLVDIKNFLDQKKESLTFFTSSQIGDVDIYATVYSQSNPRCPTSDQYDFSFGRLETQIKIETVKKSLTDNGMDEDDNVYLCLSAMGISQTKFYIQWTSQEDNIKLLDVNSYETVTLVAGDAKTFQFTPRYQDYELKFLRNRGFPFIQITNCDGTNDQSFEKCLDKIQKNKESKKQMLAKTQVFSEKICDNCIIFVRISAQQPAQLILHVQGQYNQVDLQENKMFSDFIEGEQSNKYAIMYVPSKPTIISVNVQDGDAVVQVNDFNQIKIKKSKPQNSDIIRIIIPPAKNDPILAATQDFLGSTFYSSFSQASFLHQLHISITAKDPKVSTSYTITYSSGQEEIYLQDGLVANYILSPKRQTLFYYENALEKGKIYLTVSAKNIDALNNLKIKMYNYVDPEDQDTKVQFTPQKPPARKKTANPNMLFSLPSNFKLYSFALINTKEQIQQITLLINHVQVILLPFNYQFPFQLGEGESINLLADVINQGYLNIKIKKCDDSSPTFSYTFDEKSFQKGEFNYENDLTDDPTFEYSIKANQIGTFFMNFKSDQAQKTAMTIKMTYSPQKIKSTKYKPGNKGELQYQLLSSNVAQITFKSLQCSTAKCDKNITYFTISDVNKNDLYTQTVCPAALFATETRLSVTPLTVTKISSKPSSEDKITFQYTLKDHISYVSVKAVASTGQQFYYRPIQIVTIWGQLSRTSHMHKFTMLLVIACIILVLLIWVRRNARKGYVPLEQSRD